MLNLGGHTHDFTGRECLRVVGNRAWVGALRGNGGAWRSVNKFKPLRVLLKVIGYDLASMFIIDSIPVFLKIAQSVLW